MQACVFYFIFYPGIKSLIIFGGVALLYGITLLNFNHGMFFTQRRKGNLRSKVVTTHFFAPLPLGVKPTFISENPISLKNAKRKNKETKPSFFAPLLLGVKPFSISQNSTHPVMDFYPLW